MPPRPNQGKLSQQLLSWFVERVNDDPIRIKSLSDYTQTGELGKGRFGAVLKYMNNLTMTYETVKAVNLDMFDHWGQDSSRVSVRLNLFIQEFRHLHKISLANDRIANFIGIYADSSQLLIFTEYLPNGSVKEKIAKDAVTEELAIKYFCDAVEALHYLHTLNPPVIHRDIKAANLLITIRDSIKLANFGLVRDLAVDGFGIAVASEITLDFRGTLLYVAPEVLTSDLGPGNRKAYGLPADVWALGCTFIEMLAKYPPHFEYFGIVEEMQKELVQRATGKEEERLPYNAETLVPTCSRNVQKVLDRIFERDPEIRPNTKTLKSLLPLLKPQTTPSFVVDCAPSTSSSSISPVPPPTIRIPPTIRRIEPDSDKEEDNEPNEEKIATFIPMETLENGVLRRKRTVHVKKKRKYNSIMKFIYMLMHYISRFMYFTGILANSVAYILVFIVLGMGTLTLFLFIAYCIVLFFRYLVKLHCQCDLNQPQYLIISGILLILLFALLFSCCMVALGEYKFRKANNSLRESRFYATRPSNDVKLCGIRILRSEKNRNRSDSTSDTTEMVPLTSPQSNNENTDEEHGFYYR